MEVRSSRRMRTLMTQMARSRPFSYAYCQHNEARKCNPGENSGRVSVSGYGAYLMREPAKRTAGRQDDARHPKPEPSTPEYRFDF